MAQVAKCEICGGLYNERYVHAHMRRSHGKEARETPEVELIQEILSRAAKLSEAGRELLLRRLAEPYCGGSQRELSVPARNRSDV